MNKHRLVLMLLITFFIVSLLPTYNLMVVKATPITGNFVANTSSDWGGVGTTYQQTLFRAKDLWWIFWSSGTNMYLNTTSDGFTFSSGTLVRNTVTTGYRYSVDTNGTHFAYVFSQTDQFMNYIYFRMATLGTDGSITWVTTEQQVPTLTNTRSFDPDIIFDTDDEIWVSFGEMFVNNTGFAYVTKNNWVNGSWNTQAGFPYKIADTNFVQVTGNPVCWVELVRLTGGKIYAIASATRAWDESGNRYCAEGNLWSGSAWQGHENVTSSYTGPGSLCAVPEDDDIHFTFWATDSTWGGYNETRYVRYTYGTGWGSELYVRNIEPWQQMVTSINVETGAFYGFWLEHATYGEGNRGGYKTLIDGVWDTEATYWLTDTANFTQKGGRLQCNRDTTSGNVGFIYETPDPSGPYEIKFAILPSGSYSFHLHGLFNEDTGLHEGAVDVTAYFTDQTSETVTVNGTKNVFHTSQPLYFSFDLGTNGFREYWASADEYTGSIYIFNITTTTFTVSFLDLAGALDDYPFVEAQFYINGSLMTVEKRKVDVENKLQFNLKQGRKYTLIIKDGSTWTFGDLLFASTPITLTLKGIQFPKETLMTCKYVRIYCLRVFSSPNGTLTITYQDLLNMTTSVKIEINYKNGTNVYTDTETTNSFSHEWASASNDTDYALVCTITHERYGAYTWKNYYPREGFSGMPWGLDWLGTSLPFNTAYIIPALLILFAGGCFSVINAEVGAFAMVVVAIIIAYMGWLPISGATLMVAFSLAILMALVVAKRRVET